MNNSIAIEAKGLVKQLREIRAVDGLSFTVYSNDIFGFLGPNGSGKSTTIRMLLSLVRPDAGTISILGMPLHEQRMSILARVGAFIEKPDFYEYLSAEKNLRLLSRYSGITPSEEKISEVLEITGLGSRGYSKVKTYSKGMKQRLGIAQALLHDPEVLILDEPASGLDPAGMHDIRELIRYLNREKGITILLSSHNLQEIEQIANRVLIINHGRKVMETDAFHPAEVPGCVVSFVTDRPEEAKRAVVASSLAFENLEIDGRNLNVRCSRNEIPLINRLLVEHGFLVESIRVENNLEQFFLALT